MVRFGDVLLKNKNFTLLWFAQVISHFGDRLSQMALIALVYRQVPGSSLALAKLTSFTIIPVFVIGPVAGAWVDRWDRRDVMVVSDVLRGLLALLLSLFIMLGQMPLVYLVIFLIFSITRFFISSRMAIIPELVAREQLLVANSLQDITRMIGNAIGLVVAGLIVNIKFIGAIGGFLIYSACFFTSAALMGMIVKKEFLTHIKDDLIVATHVLEESIRKSIFAEIMEGIRVMFKYSEMRFIVATFSLLMAGIGSVYCVLVTFIQEVFGNATKDLSFLMLYLLAGLFAGIVAYGRFGQRLSKRRMIFSSFTTTGIAAILFALLVRAYASHMVSAILAFVMGLAVSPIMVSANTLAHEVMPKEVRGKVFSALEAVMHLAFLLCMFLTGALEKYIDKVWILVGSGVIFSLFGIAGFILGIRRKAVTSC
jgi:MFS family permease